jgi:4-hydroxybenzoate polyprenyltransferase
MTTAAAAQPPAPSVPVLTRLKLAAADIKLAHSVFALPFALLAAFLARPEGSTWPRFAGQLTLIVLCMVAARTWAMLINRLADRRFDAANPRTQRRILASGKMSARDATSVAAGSALLFIATASLFYFAFANPWPPILAVPVLIWIAFYSFTKRFTALCHIFLGGALAASPLAAAIAINPESLTTPVLYFLAGMVLLWVAGFDVIYALQDLDFDRTTGLSSIPAKLGPTGAIWTSRLMHAAAFTLLVLAARSDGRFGPLFYTAVAAVAALLITEHVVLAKHGQAGLNMAFFTINGVVSCVLGAAGILDLTIV